EWQPWGHLLESVKTGKPVFKTIFGVEIFDYLADDPAAAKIYNQAISSFSDKKMLRSQWVTTSHQSVT
ncbi:hypothetical protein H6F93_09495, partial [Leptolyngbya sp. FACHB-671]